MKLRVRADAGKGHVVRGQMIAPGGVLPGDYEAVPPLMGWKLEPVPVEPQPAAEPATTPAVIVDQDEPVWYAELAARLGKEPTKADLHDYAVEHGVDLQEPILKADMIRAIDEAL